MRSALPGDVFDLELIDRRSGQITFRAVGQDAKSFFQDEAGGHRWQRIPPTERRGRVQTSTITIAVLPEPDFSQLRLEERDIEVSTCRGSGAGGQHRNKTESAVQILHKPTGVQVRCESERSQHQNRATALALLRARLWEAQREKSLLSRAQDRKQQIGSGMRGDKRRTIRCQDGVVNDHITGKCWRFKDYARGDW